MGWMPTGILSRSTQVSPLFFLYTRVRSSYSRPGKVGLGPNYSKGAGFHDKAAGLKEEIKGKLTHNPQTAQHGHDMRTGEL